MVRTVDAPALHVASRPPSIETVELADPGPDGLRVKIHAAGLCQSDLSAVDGDRPWQVPVVFGHEVAAEVLKVGHVVVGVKVGDHVVTASTGWRPSATWRWPWAGPERSTRAARTGSRRSTRSPRVAWPPRSRPRESCRERADAITRRGGTMGIAGSPNPSARWALRAVCPIRLARGGSIRQMIMLA